jgi:hypothetical protein
MAKKRAKVDRDLFESTEVTKDKQEAKEEELTRATYYIPPEQKEAVTRRATDLGIPASQLAIFLLSDALQRFDASEIDPSAHLTRSDSPKFRNNLAFGDWYYAGDDS